MFWKYHAVEELNKANGNKIALMFTSADNMFVDFPNTQNHLFIILKIKHKKYNEENKSSSHSTMLSICFL